MSEILFGVPDRLVADSKRLALRKPPWTSWDERLKQTFLNDSMSEQDRYSYLFSYFVSGFLYYRARDLAHAYYPGARSNHGANIDAMEGFSRILPMISAWISAKRPPAIRTLDGDRISLAEVSRAGLLAGTNPKSKGFWGHVHHGDQRIVEAADLALSIWLLRDQVWPQLSLSERKAVAVWLSEVNEKMLPDNNWHLFPVLVNAILHSLGYPSAQGLARAHYNRLKSFYRGNGWFSDGPGRVFDYYNAWGIHYALFWLSVVDPQWDSDFIDKSLSDFLQNYKFLFSTHGFPITGRSICYRMGAPAPLVAGAARGLEGVTPGMARRALDCVWRYFIAKGAVRQGRPTQGYWEDDLRLLDNYSGPASSLWSLRSLIVAFYCPPESEFWTAPLEKLPVEEGDYDIFIPEIGWRVRGDHCSRDVQISKVDNANNAPREMQRYGFLGRLAEYATCRPFRPGNNYLRYDLWRYSSLRPFWTQARERSLV